MKTAPCFHAYPFLPLTASLILGMSVGRFFLLSAHLSSALLLVAALLLAGILLWRCRRLQTITLLLATALIGMVLMVAAERKASPALPAGENSFRGIIMNEPVDKPRTVSLDLRIISGPLSGHTVRAYLQKDSLQGRYRSLQVGGGIDFYACLEPLYSSPSSHSDYSTYLKVRHIVAQTYITDDAWCAISASRAALSRMERTRLSALKLRHLLLSHYRELGMAGQELAVISAMTLGDKSGLTAQTRDAYSMTGTSHILALSGTHLGIIFSLFVLLLGNCSLSILKSCLVLTAVWCYVFLVGMPVSAVRAAVMLSVYVLVSLTGRNAVSLNTLAFTAFMMLWANPLLLFDVSFQLSFIAVASIMLLYPSFSAWVSAAFLGQHRVVRFVWQLMVISVIAQIGTAPMVAYYFGCVSLSFLLSNLLVVPMATGIIYASVFLLPFSFVPAVAHPAYALLSYGVSRLNALLYWMSTWPGATVGNISLTPWQLFLWYLLIACLSGVWVRLSRVHLRQKM